MRAAACCPSARCHAAAPDCGSLYFAGYSAFRRTRPGPWCHLRQTRFSWCCGPALRLRLGDAPHDARALSCGVAGPTSRLSGQVAHLLRAPRTAWQCPAVLRFPVLVPVTTGVCFLLSLPGDRGVVMSGAHRCAAPSKPADAGCCCVPAGCCWPAVPGVVPACRVQPPVAVFHHHRTCC